MSFGPKCKVCLDYVVDNRCGCGGGLIAPTPFVPTSGTLHGEEIDGVRDVTHHGPAHPQPLGEDVEGNPMPKEPCSCGQDHVCTPCLDKMIEMCNDAVVHGQTPAETWRYGTWLGYVAAFCLGGVVMLCAVWVAYCATR